MKLADVVTILKSVAPMHWTQETALAFDSAVCRVAGCTRRGDFDCQIEVRHPTLLKPHTQAVLFCEGHVRMLEHDLLVWDWHASAGKVALGTSGIWERPDVV